MPTPQRLPIVNSDDGVWGDILRQYLLKEHYDDGTDNAVNGGHKTITIRAGTSGAGTAPLKFTSGTLMSSAEAGAIEYNGGFYMTLSGNVRTEIVGADTTQTLTNKTLTTPKISTINDTNGNTILDLPATASAVNHIYFGNHTTGNSPVFGVDGSDTNISLSLQSKGTGVINILRSNGHSTLQTAGGYNSGNVNLELNSQGSGVVRANGNPVITTSTAIPNVTGTPSSSTYLRGDGTWATVAAGSTSYTANVGDGSSTSIVVTHNLGSRNVVVAVYDATTYEEVDCDVFRTTTNTITLTFATAPATNAYVCVVSNGASGGTTLNSTSITDSTTVGRSVLTATDATAARTAISAISASSTDTLTNKTLTSPRLTDSIRDSNGNVLISNEAWSSSAVNYLGVESSPSGSQYVQLSALGTDTNIDFAIKPKGTGNLAIYVGSNSSAVVLANGSSANVDLDLKTKGTGKVKANSVDVVTTTGTQTLTNKTIPGVTGMLMPVQHHANGGETYTIVSGSVTQIAGTTIQSQAVNIGDRILVMGAPASSGAGTQFNFTTQPANGIYVVTGNTTNLTVTRATDMSGSVHPAGLSVYSTNSSAGWLGQGMFSVALPGTPASFTYGTDSIKWRVSGGASLLPNTVYIANTSHGLGWWNGAYSTYINPQATSADQDLNLPKQTSDTLLGATNLPAVNGNSAAQQQVVVSGTSYYITGSDLLASPATPISGMVVGTRYVWRVAMTKTAAGTGTFQIVIYRGTNGTTSDTADVTQTIGTQTAAVDNMVVDVEVIVTATGASGSYYWSIIPMNKAATATGFGVATGTGAFFSGTKSSVAMNTASLKFGLGFIATTGTPTITIPYVQANAYKLV